VELKLIVIQKLNNRRISLISDLINFVSHQSLNELFLNFSQTLSSS
jgi:hypothetical protein